MRPTVFILGTSHPLQCGAAECGADRISLLEQKIRRALSEHSIRRIAEEMSEDGLRRILGDKAASETVCKRVARDTGVQVDFVDLGETERRRLNLSDNNINSFMFKYVENDKYGKIRDSFSFLCGEVRERVWVARVLSGREWPVLFVCGANHAVSVQQLFESVGVQATILCRDFDPEHAP